MRTGLSMVQFVAGWGDAEGFRASGNGGGVAVEKSLLHHLLPGDSQLVSTVIWHCDHPRHIIDHALRSQQEQEEGYYRQ